jgi:hypothetical protein
MGYGVWGMGYGVWGMGYGVWGMGYGVWGTLAGPRARARASGTWSRDPSRVGPVGATLRPGSVRACRSYPGRLGPVGATRVG